MALAGMSTGPALAGEEYDLTKFPGVKSYIVLNKTGIPVKTVNMDQQKAVMFAGLVSELAISAREFLLKRLFRPEDDDTEIRNLRLRTEKYELIICPDDNYTLIVVHSPFGHEEEEEKPAEKEVQKKEDEETEEKN